MRILVAALALVATTATAQAQAVTTRIETRPYYGAITTIEHGVRVTRALPAHDRIIINPQGKTPLSLNIGGGDGGSVVQNSTTQTINQGRGGPAYGVPYYGAPHHGPRYPLRRPHMDQGSRTVTPKH